jgi:glycosyltransferase involved in cell wall biosynthesis
VNNGSTDGTQELLTKMELPSNIRWIRVPVNKGYGFGIVSGLRELTTEYVGWIHADLQINPSCLLLFLNHLDSNVDFLKGFRRGRGITERFFTASMSICLSMMFGTLLRDINGQPTVLKRSLYTGWQDPPNDFGLDLFAYVNAIRNQSRIVRIDVDFFKRKHGKSSWNSGFKSRFRFILVIIKLATAIRRKSRA